MRRTEARIPMIKCLPRADFLGGMQFWCPFCRKWHLHGRGRGSRAPHCDCSSQLYESGYKIEMFSQKELREIKKDIEDWLSMQNKKEFQ